MNRSLVRVLKTLLFVVLGILSVSSQAQNSNADIYGKWKIASFAGSADSFGLNNRQIRALIGKPVVINADRFAFNGQTCKRPTYSRSVEETTTYFRREWQADASELQLPNPVTVIDTGCNKLYLLGKDRILVAEQSGVFFEAARVKSPFGRPRQKQ